MPRFLHCGGFDTRLHAVVLWQSAGGTRSVIHNDGQDALNCQLAGEKHWIFWNPKSAGLLETPSPHQRLASFD